MNILSLDFVNYLLASLVLISHIAFVLVLVYFLIARLVYGNNFRVGSVEFFSRNGLLLSFIISLTATMGSLFYSEIAGYDPCKLCWLERIFMYPQTILLGIALLKRDFKILSYSISTLFPGLLFALYHNYIYIMKTSSSFCGITGVSCIKRYVFEFGYITIPVMSLTAFILIMSLLILQGAYLKKLPFIVGSK